MDTGPWFLLSRKKEETRWQVLCDGAQFWWLEEVRKSMPRAPKLFEFESLRTAVLNGISMAELGESTMVLGKQEMDQMLIAVELQQ